MNGLVRHGRDRTIDNVRTQRASYHFAHTKASRYFISPLEGTMGMFKLENDTNTRIGNGSVFRGVQYVNL
ncbi:hypothetical protein Y032_0007g3475 [Ancylostoma ceylanicum]|uniref:Uncharacterized protein n=1 Tax=Ancylostoma ceylanicum TaxID=53326 RepID=A0A016VQ33_9BILA|nr:hypothetical protein Y032_0007g3475 [Ancylostoma ceylanicum]